ncbi:unnamed protein product [Boreogadus saida]
MNIPVTCYTCSPFSNPTVTEVEFNSSRINVSGQCRIGPMRGPKVPCGTQNKATRPTVRVVFHCLASLARHLDLLQALGNTVGTRPTTDD